MNEFLRLFNVIPYSTGLMVALTVIACLSPLLTLAHLWQLKEWRIDRMMEHLRNGQWFRQLFGIARPVFFVFLLMLAISMAPASWRNILIGLPLLALMSVLQILLKRQSFPVWTKKAVVLICTTLVLDAAWTFFIFTSVFSWFRPLFPMFLATSTVLLLPLVQSVILTFAWLLFSPVDRLLKKRVLDRAMKLRLSHEKLTVIGITGSVGKTTTKELLAHILKKKGAIATPIHVNTEMGVAAWLTNLLKDKPQDWHSILIVEMGAYRKGEIRLLSQIAKPQIGIVTYIGQQHLSLFGSQEAIGIAKGELIEALPENGHAFLNEDNEASHQLKKRAKCPVTTVGTGGHPDLAAFDIEETSKGIRFTALDTKFEVPLAGTHLVTGILLAIAAAKSLGMEPKEIAREIATFVPLPQTFEVKTINGVTVLDDTYNASPDSFRAAIEWARSQPHTEKVVLTEGIIELGQYEASIHSALAEEAAPIFNRAYIRNARYLPYFRDGGFEARAHLLSSGAEKVKVGALLVCIGRMPRSAIDQLLPDKAAGQ